MISYNEASAYNGKMVNVIRYDFGIARAASNVLFYLSGTGAMLDSDWVSLTDIIFIGEGI